MLCTRLNEAKLCKNVTANNELKRQKRMSPGTESAKDASQLSLSDRT